MYQEGSNQDLVFLLFGESERKKGEEGEESGDEGGSEGVVAGSRGNWKRGEEGNGEVGEEVFGVGRGKDRGGGVFEGGEGGGGDCGS